MSQLDETDKQIAQDEASAPFVLIVDDNIVDQRVAGANIESGLGWSIAYAGDGNEALAAMAVKLPDVVLTDLQMPNMDGLELVGEIRSTYPSVPVVLMTAFGSEKIAMKALELGAASYVPKLSLHQDLAATLEQVVNAAKRRHHSQHLDECLNLAEFHFTVENDPALIPVLIRRFQEYLAAMKLAGRDGDIRVGIAVEEALLNALFHGNLEVPSELRLNGDAPFHALASNRRHQSPYKERKIHVTARITGSEAAFVIRDEGPGFHVSKLPDPTSVQRTDYKSKSGSASTDDYVWDKKSTEKKSSGKSAWWNLGDSDKK